MKNLLLYSLLFLMAFAGCKDDDVKEPEFNQLKVYDAWRKLPDSILNTKNEGIVALEKRGNEVHIHTENKYFALDTNLNEVDNESLELGGSWYQLWGPRYGEEYSILPIDATSFKVADNSQVANTAVTFETTNNLFAASTKIVHYSNIRSENTFYTVSSAYNQDSVWVELQKWKIIHTKGTSEPIQLEEISSLRIDSSRNPSVALGYLKVYNFGNRVLINDGVNVSVYEDSTLLSNYYFTFENLFERDGVIYGGGNDRANLFDRDQKRKVGLVKSLDGGLTWQFTSTDNSLDRLLFKEIDGQVFAFGQGGFGKMSNDFTTLIPADTEGLFDGPRNLAKVGKYALVGTDEGLYYKSWESFINK